MELHVSLSHVSQYGSFFFLMCRTFKQKQMCCPRRIISSFYNVFYIFNDFCVDSNYICSILYFEIDNCGKYFISNNLNRIFTSSWQSIYVIKALCSYCRPLKLPCWYYHHYKVYLDVQLTAMKLSVRERDFSCFLSVQSQLSTHSWFFFPLILSLCFALCLPL